MLEAVLTCVNLSWSLDNNSNSKEIFIVVQFNWKDSTKPKRGLGLQTRIDKGSIKVKTFFRGGSSINEKCVTFEYCSCCDVPDTVELLTTTDLYIYSDALR